MSMSPMVRALLPVTVALAALSPQEAHADGAGPIEPEPRRGAPTRRSDDGVPSWAWVTGGIGVVSAAASLTFLGMHLSVASEIDERCGGEARDRCPPDTQYDAASAERTETATQGLAIGFGVMAVVGLGVGTAGLVRGLLGAGKEEPAAVEVAPLAGPGLAGAVVRVEL